MAKGCATIGVATGQFKVHDKAEVFDVYKASKIHVMYEEFYAVTMIDIEIESHYIV